MFCAICEKKFPANYAARAEKTMMEMYEPEFFASKEFYRRVGLKAG